MATKEEALEVEGTILEAMKGCMFRVQVQNMDQTSGITVLATLAGKLRKNNIRVVAGDRVKLELSPYDLTRGRITYRVK